MFHFCCATFVPDNPYGDGGTKEWDFSNRGNSRVDSSRSRGDNTRSRFDNIQSMADNSAIAQLDKMGKF